MERYFTSPHLVDFILVLVVFEAIVLAWWGKPLRAILAMLAPGACLMLALRAALDGAAWPWASAALAAALVAHLADLRERWRG